MSGLFSLLILMLLFRNTCISIVWKFFFLGIFFTVLSAPVNAQEPPLPDIETGLVTHLLLDEAGGIIAFDSSGNNNYGTLNNSPEWTTGYVDNGLDFNGTNSDVIGNFSLNSEAFTLSVWIRSVALPAADFPTIYRIKKSGLTNGYIWMYFFSPSYEFNNHRRVVLQYQDAFGAITTLVATNTLIDLDTWTHLAITYDGNTNEVKFYKNGSYSESKTLALATAIDFDEFHLGHIANNNNTALDGILDEARIYNRALTDRDIQGLYDFAGGGEAPEGGTSPDMNPPVRSHGLPAGTLAAGITSATLSLKTDENASCKYDILSGLSYEVMVSLFSTTGFTNHSVALSGLSNGKTYTYYVKCEDTSGNKNATDFTISFSVATPDTVPPVRSAGSPTGALPNGTSSVAMSLVTDEGANCRYNTITDTQYTSMTGTFGSTGGKIHSTVVSGLTDGNTYRYYIRCEDVSMNLNPDDYTISFSINSINADDSTPDDETSDDEVSNDTSSENETSDDSSPDEDTASDETSDDEVSDDTNSEDGTSDDSSPDEGEGPFPDVSSVSVYVNAISYMKEEGIVEGFPDGYFRPEQKINRAEFLKILILLRFDEVVVNSCIPGKISSRDATVYFPDIPKSEWFAPYICIGKAAKIVDGYPDGYFRPERNISLVEAAKIVVNVFGFSLSSSPTPWYRPFMEILTAKNAIPDTIVYFTHEVTRGEMSEMLYRLEKEITNLSSPTYQDFQ